MRAATEVAVEGEHGVGKNLVALLLERSRSAVGACHKTSNGWEEQTWGQLVDQVQRISAGLVGAGVKPGDRVAIFAATGVVVLLKISIGI